MSALSLIEQCAALTSDEQAEVLAELDRQSVGHCWRVWSRPAQRAPAGDWQTWLVMAGRGFGKTRAGAEWVRGLAKESGLRIALVGATIADARAVMVEGESGLLSIGRPQDRPLWEPGLGRLRWRSGSEARIFSGENPDGLRGPQHHFAWCDEIAKWARPTEAWDNLRLGLRLGPNPRATVTTTPRPIPLLKRIHGAAGTVTTRGGTRDNPVLSPAYLEAMEAAYGGTRFGRQELEGALIEDVEGALWTRAGIEASRAAPGRAEPERMKRVVIGVDPPASSGGDSCGIVAAGLGIDEVGYVLADHSVGGLSPEGWARAVANAAALHGADRVVAEKNQGGEMVESVLKGAEAGLPVKLVHASRGKAARAEPVSVLFDKGRAKFAGAFPELEDELAGLCAGGEYRGPGRSPDRADAMVWALTELMLGREVREPRVGVV